jgi:DNA-binding protein HU-beta
LSRNSAKYLFWDPCFAWFFYLYFSQYLKFRRFLMNKGELVDLVAEKAGISKKQADSVISATVEAIMETVAQGEKVTLVGFGSFERRERKAREGRNPKTNEKMQIPATSVPAFSAGKQFKEMVAPK